MGYSIFVTKHKTDDFITAMFSASLMTGLSTCFDDLTEICVKCAIGSVCDHKKVSCWKIHDHLFGLDGITVEQEAFIALAVLKAKGIEPYVEGTDQLKILGIGSSKTSSINQRYRAFAHQLVKIQKLGEKYPNHYFVEGESFDDE
jgi:hypothetical protein